MKTAPTRPAFVVDRTTPRSMRRRPPFVLFGTLLIALAAWLAGRGLGWFGTGNASATPATPSASAAPSAAASPAAAVPTANAAPTAGQPAIGQPASGQAASGQTASGGSAPANPAQPEANPDERPAQPASAPVARTGQPAQVEVPPGLEPPANPVANPVAAPGASAREAVDEDRFATRLSLLRARLAEGAFGQAEAVRQQMLAWDLDTSQRLRLVADADALALAVDAALVRLGDHVDGGRVLAAREQLRRLVGEGEPAVLPWLAGLLRAAGLPPELATGTASPAALPPTLPPTPLPRGRLLRWRRGNNEQTGEVADSSAATVTVRVSSGESVAFPTMALPEVEPVDATPAEAVEMGLAALQAGDVALARLWLCFARRRAPGGLGERGEQLIRHLR